MIKKIKVFLIRAFLLLGYKIVGRRKIVKHNDFDSIHKFLLEEEKKLDQIIIFDVGANVGQSITRFNQNFKKSKIYSFEPIPYVFEKLKKNIKNDNVQLHNLALSSTIQERDLNIYNYHQASSFYKIKKNSKFQKFRELGFKDNSMKSIKLKTETIDNFVEKNSIENIDLLKIDTQGHEGEVLAGAKNFLSKEKIKIIEVEFILGIAYENDLNFSQIEKYLIPNGYKLIAIDEAGNVLAHSSYQLTLIYVNQEIFKTIESIHKKNVNIKNVTGEVNYKKPFNV